MNLKSPTDSIVGFSSTTSQKVDQVESQIAQGRGFVRQNSKARRVKEEKKYQGNDFNIGPWNLNG